MATTWLSVHSTESETTKSNAGAWNQNGSGAGNGAGVCRFASETLEARSKYTNPPRVCTNAHRPRGLIATSTARRKVPAGQPVIDAAFQVLCVTYEPRIRTIAISHKAASVAGVVGIAGGPTSQL